MGLMQGALLMSDSDRQSVMFVYKHGTPVDVFESASERRGADGIDARA
jgi:hypothetical protein